jgi:3-hydroxybutyryl-CoA dehydrogenase
MRILIVGGESDFEAVEKKFGFTHQYTRTEPFHLKPSYISGQDLVLDFSLDEYQDHMDIYNDFPGLKVWANIPKTCLAELYFLCENCKIDLVGFNGLPGFFERDLLELSVFEERQIPALDATCTHLGLAYQLVDDRVGMVTPRVICMIINEAYYTVMEGTATREDIDKGMKLGTNYPMGPFEWCEKIGLHHVYELLDALYENTREARYKICPLLKKEYLKSSVLR